MDSIHKKPTGLYASREMTWMTWFQDMKGMVLKPLLFLLTQMGVSADIVSVFSGCIAVVALTFSVYASYPALFLMGIWLHLIVDGIDGSLARYQKTQGTFGSIVDCVFDVIGIIATCVYAVYFNIASPLLLCFFGALYMFVIGTAFLFNHLGTPYAFVIRPRLFLFGSLTIDYLLLLHLTPTIIILSIVIMSITTLQGLWKLGTLLRR